jgi:hypothetical protein
VHHAVVKKPAARPRVLTITAERGSCWLKVRRGDTTVFYGTLVKGRTLRFRLATELWMRIGAPDNLLATINGRRVSLPGDTANVIFR